MKGNKLLATKLPDPDSVIEHFSKILEKGINKSTTGDWMYVMMQVLEDMNTEVQVEVIKELLEHTGTNQEIFEVFKESGYLEEEDNVFVPQTLHDTMKLPILQRFYTYLSLQDLEKIEAKIAGRLK